MELHTHFIKINKKINVEEELTHIKDITVIESSSIKALNSFDIVIQFFIKNSSHIY